MNPTGLTNPLSTSPYGGYNRTPYRSPMYNSYSSPMYRAGMGGMYGGYGGMGGMYGGGMYGGGMYGGGMYGGMYGNGMEQSGPMLALERISMLVNSLCFTAETIERSMHSMAFFWESLKRIKTWAYQGIVKLLLWNKKKAKAIINMFLYMIGKR